MIPLVLERDSDTPLAAQISTGVRALVSSGGLRGGDPVPSTRQLAAELGVSRGTVVAAYDQLVSESYLVARPGGKTRINPAAGSLPSLGPTPDRVLDRRVRAGTAVGNAESVEIDLRPGARLVQPIDDSAWREAWRSAATGDGVRESDQGLERVRVAISDHLRLMRSMTVDPDDVFITGGARDGLLLTLAALRETRDVDSVAVQTPGYPGLLGAIRRAGLRTIGVPVDREGMIPGLIPREVGGVLVTPNHLYPAGGSMPAPRRIELLGRVRARGGLAVEDDLDSEYRHVGPVMPTLWELDPDSVVHLGTFNQVLTSEARIGYLIAPPHLHAALLEARRDLGAGTSAITQRAVGTYLANGGLRRRIIRRRRDLLRRRGLVQQALGAHGVDLRAGGTAIVRLSSVDEAERVIAECQRRGVRVGSLARYWHRVSTGEDQGIVFTYGHLDFEAVVRAVEHLVDALSQV